MSKINLDPNVTLKVGKDSIKIKLDRDFKLTNELLIEAPTNYAYLLVLKNKALRALNTTKELRDTAYFELFAIIMSAEEESRFPLSDKKIESEIAEDKDYVQLRKKLLNARAYYELVSDMAEAFRVCIETKRTLSANKRADKKS